MKVYTVVPCVAQSSVSSKQQLTVAGLVLVLGSPVAGQPLDTGVLAVLQGPPPPVAPEVVSRDAQGRVTVRATRLTAPLQIDGRLDEPVYETVRSITDFIQQLPDEGARGSERTEAWVLFDDDSIYISGALLRHRPAERVGGERDASGRHSSFGRTTRSR